MLMLSVHTEISIVPVVCVTAGPVESPHPKVRIAASPRNVGARRLWIARMMSFVN
jgi:hypothetical protein